MLKANNPALSSWIAVSSDSDFPIQNIPFGVFKTAEKSPRVATIIGDTVIDLENQASGCFFLFIRTEQKVWTERIVKL